MDSSSSQTPAEAKDLSLLSKVEMRIALADTESKLESTLRTYLTPMLLKLASDHISVRNKVRAFPCSLLKQPDKSKLSFYRFASTKCQNLSGACCRLWQIWCNSNLSSWCYESTAHRSRSLLAQSAASHPWYGLLVLCTADGGFCLPGHINLSTYQHPNQATVRLLPISS